MRFYSESIDNMHEISSLYIFPEKCVNNTLISFLLGNLRSLILYDKTNDSVEQINTTLFYAVLMLSSHLLILILISRPEMSGKTKN